MGCSVPEIELAEKQSTYQIKELKDDKGNYKKAASIKEISEYITQHSPKESKQTQLNLLERVISGNFMFEIPEEVSSYAVELPLSLKHGLQFSPSEVRNFAIRIESYIRERCNWFAENNIQYEFIDYEQALSHLNDGDNGRGRQNDFISQYTLSTIERKIFNKSVEEDTHAECDCNALALLLYKIPPCTEEQAKEVSDGLFVKEIKKMRLALSGCIYLNQKAFLQWLRLGYNTNSKSFNSEQNLYFIPLQYNGFWGNPWEGCPKSWNPRIDDKAELILKEAFKYYSNPHNWAKYEKELKKLKLISSEVDNILSTVTQRKEQKDLSIKIFEMKEHLLNIFLEHFNPENNRLEAAGYFEKFKAEPVSYLQLRDMVEGNQLDVERSIGGLGKTNVTSIRIKMVDNSHKNNPYPQEDYINPRIKETLLKMIIAMAVHKYKFNPDAMRNNATANIKTALLNVGLSLDEEIILKYLREAASLVPNEKWEEF